MFSKSINFNKNEKESKMENLKYSVRETNLAFQLIQESQRKSKTDELELTKEKKTAFIVTFILCERNFFKTCFISMYSAMNKLSEYIHL